MMKKYHGRFTVLILFLSTSHLSLTGQDIIASVTTCPALSNDCFGSITVTIDPSELDTDWMLPFEIEYINTETGASDYMEVRRYEFTIEDLCSGNHDLTLHLDSSCEYTFSANVETAIELYRGEDLIVIDDCIDGVPNGSISFRNPLGNGYKYKWTGPGGFTSNQQDIPGLEPGEYCVKVKHVSNPSCIYAKGCVTVGVSKGPKVSLVDIEHNSFCHGSSGGMSCDGLLQIQVPYGVEIEWLNVSNSDEANSSLVTDLCTGTYMVLVTVNDCTTEKSFDIICCGEASIDGDDYVPLQASATVTGATSESANDGSIDLHLIGGTNDLMILWSGPNGFSSMDEDIFNLDIGTYCVQLDDGCTQFHECYEIVDCSQFDITISGEVSPACPGYNVGSIVTSVSSGTAPYKYNWSNGQKSSDLYNLGVGNYSLTISDKNGCSSIMGFQVTSVNVNRLGCIVYCGNEEVENYGPPIAVTNSSNCAYIDNVCSVDGYFLSSKFVGTHLHLDDFTCTLTERNNVTGGVCPGSTIPGVQCRACIFGSLPNEPTAIANCGLHYCFFPSIFAFVVHDIEEFPNVLAVTNVGETETCHFQIFNNCTDIHNPIFSEIVPCKDIESFRRASCSEVIPKNILLEGDPFGGCGSPTPFNEGSLSDYKYDIISNENATLAPFAPNTIKNGTYVKIEESSNCEYITLHFISSEYSTVNLIVRDLFSSRLLLDADYEAVNGLNTVSLENRFYSPSSRESNKEFLVILNFSTGHSISEKINLSCDKILMEEPNLFSVLPNPFQDVLTIKIPNHPVYNALTVEIYTMSGEKVLYTNIEGNKKNLCDVNLSTLDDGAYIVKINSNGSVVFSDKIIKLDRS